MPGQKGLVQLTGDVPSWINFQDREKVKVILSLLLNVLPKMMSNSVTMPSSASIMLLSASLLPTCLDWLKVSLLLQLLPISLQPVHLMLTLCFGPEPACAGVLQWLNNVLTELWPYYDKAAAAMIKASLFPMLHVHHLPCKELVGGHCPLLCPVVHAVIASSPSAM